MKKLVALTILSVTAMCGVSQEALALAEFKKAFQEKYVENSTDEMKAAFKKTSCNTCHVKGEKKEVRNEYGEELAKLIEGDANERKKEARKAGGREAYNLEKEKLVAEVMEAFKKVEKMKNKEGQLYGEILKSGELPVSVADQ